MFSDIFFTLTGAVIGMVFGIASAKRMWRLSAILLVSYLGLLDGFLLNRLIECNILNS